MFFKRKKKNSLKEIDSIFISYRREDDPSAARSIVDRLSRVFDKSHVFFDVDTVSAGVNFEDLLKERLERTKFTVVIIGSKWESLFLNRDKNKRDYVLEEIEASLQNKDKTTVIPVLVGNASVPSSENLPDQIKELASLQAVEIRHTRFDLDVDNEIISVIKKELDPQPRRMITKKVKVPLTLLAGAPDNRRIQKEVEKQAEYGWQLAGDTFDEGLFGFGGGVTLIFQKEEEPE